MKKTNLWRLDRRLALRLDCRHLVICAVALAASGAWAEAPMRSKRPVIKPANAAKFRVPSPKTLMAQAKLGGKVSFVVADLDSGEVLEHFSPLTPHPPASVTKALTTLFALERLGSDKRFVTKLIATEPVKDGELHGDLVLMGGGDPTLDTDDLNEMADELYQSGVRRVSGAFKVRGHGGVISHIDAAQPVHVGYNPAIAGLNLNFNRIYFQWARGDAGYALSMDARTANLRPKVRFVRAQVAARKSPVFEYALVQDRETWSVASYALGKGGGRWLPVRRPEIYAGEVLQNLARMRGVSLQYPVKAKLHPYGGTELVRHESDPVEDIAKDMLKYSTNLTAEVLGLQASGAGTLLGSARTMGAWLSAEFDLRRANFVDHSGLGGASRMSARDMVEVLLAPGVAEQLEPLLKPVSPRDQSNRVIGKSPVRIVAKTGTLNFVSALAGYMKTASGRKLAFAFFMSDAPRRDALSPNEKERPRGARAWNSRAKRLQNQLLNRWAVLYRD